MNILGGKVTLKDRRKINEIITYLNLLVPSLGTAKADTISEYTAGAGVTVDGVLLKDGVAVAANGTAAAPSHTFASSTGMGFYRSSANELGVAVGGLFLGRWSQAKGYETNKLNCVHYVKVQAAPVNSNIDPADKAVMADSMWAGLLTATPAGGINYTLPTGTQMDTAVAGALGIDEGFEFSLINIGAGGTITVVAAEGFTTVGTLTIAANTSARFFVRRTAANVFVLYRLT